ncbi:hypothetical protein BBJ29_003782 [Phytophthora kernoviae]|uniref:glucan endo-1,3-beta-D-glucosidase n=1 Tax=Phytophthora kernoviae TaxID=325452 RepID=A0A3F2RRG2_9STRA|nr:hypothetical protein BBJ29_003782 [Phytophthora kernoviae]RLN61782.1 hypothetical protein BBP00_00005191 [Phytophthora kernoviae]
MLAGTTAILATLGLYETLKPRSLTDSSNVTQATPTAKFDLFTPLFNAEEPHNNLIPHTDGHKTLLPPKFLAPGLVGSRAIPTNNWWGNMIGSSPNEEDIQPVWTNPYSVTPSILSEPLGLTMNYPYTTRKFGGELTPRFGTVYSIQYINGLGSTETTNRDLTNDRFVLQFDNEITWTLYFSIPVSLRFDGNSTLEMESPFTGTARVAMIPDASAREQSIFDRTASCLLEGGQVQAHDEHSYTYKWKTSGDCESNGMLHYAQVHHVDTLDRASAVEVEGISAHSTTRGLMQGLVTKTSPPEWRLVETEDFPVDFYPPRKPDTNIVNAYDMKKTLIADINATWSITLSQSYYYMGKAAQKYASLCLMAADPSVVGEDDTALLSQCIEKLENALAPFLDNSWMFPLNYDTVYRGVVSSQGFTMNDAMVDFGNTMYNDHHYHYGYWVVTAAIVNKLDPSWSKLPELNHMAGFLVRDVANPSDDDPYFPKFRSLDWYRGHSYSHGITPLADGKDEESTSEDMNFYYGMAMLGKATGNTHLETVGKLLIKLNARAIRTYFLLEDGNRAHPDHYRDNKVMGILFDNKVNYATWFSAEKYAIHGIQMIPVTAVTEFVRTRDFVQQEWEYILSHEPIVQNDELSNPWLSLLYMNYATVNKELALKKLSTVKMDDGLSRSWALYIAATRP